MSSPYWGQLPPPPIQRQDSLRREADLRFNQRALPIDTQFDPPSSQAQPKRNRDTMSTDAPTTSTQSPFASPISSNFQGDGLKPRPPSFPYGSGAPPPEEEFSERRKRRENRRNRMLEENASSPVPSHPAPEPPRAPPPISYKAPYNNGGFPLTQQAPLRTRTNQHSDGTISPLDALKSKESYRSEREGTPATLEEIQVAEEMPIKATNGNAVLHQVGSERQPEALNISQPQSRKGSASDVEAKRRREWAPDRSPLQRLELTLDSITKEEKRARIEEAELLAREAKAGRGGDKSNPSSVPSRKPVAKAPEHSEKQEPQSLPEAGLIRSLSTHQKEELQRSATVDDKRLPRTEARGFDYHPNPEVVNGLLPSEKSPAVQDVPNTRERTELPTGTIAALAAGAGTAASGAGVHRRTSNKLKKHPPGDPWLHRRTEAEKRYPNIVPKRPSAENSILPVMVEAGPSNAAAQARQSTGANSYNESEEPIPKDHPMAPFDPYAPKTPNPPVRRGSARKIAQLTGQKLPPLISKPLPLNPRQRAQHEQKMAAKHLSGTTGVENVEAPTKGDPPGSQYAHDDHHRYLDMLDRRKHANDDGVYDPPSRLEEWKQGGVAKLCDDLLDLEDFDSSGVDKNKTWWEAGNSGKRRDSTRNRAEAYEGEYTDSNAPTRFKPHLHLECGPLLRYCGLRRERRQGPNPVTREIWRGSVMIVTKDAQSSYELAPTLRLFLQPISLLPPPPKQIDGDIAPEYVDPIAGLPKIDRDGKTLYVRPVDHIPEARDLSSARSDAGLFEKQRSNPDEGQLSAYSTTSEHLKPKFDGEKAGKYKEVRGCRLHTERGLTFWRFNIEVELRDAQQRIAYRINRGPATGFWIPGRNQAMNIMFHSCNGFSSDIDTDSLSGPDPMWRDVLNTHQTQPFHVMLGGGDQIYMDNIMDKATLFKRWLEIKDYDHKESTPLTSEMQHELETFYLERYCKWFSQGLFGLANSQIPMVNMWDDHDILDGFGSFADDYMRSPVMSGLGMVAFKYYMLFQHQSSVDEGEEDETSWLLGSYPGPYISEMSRSVFTFLGRSVAFLGLDCRTERTNDDILTDETYEKVAARLKRDIIKGETKHMIVMLGVPIAYPRMVWLENILTSKLMGPVKALGRAGVIGNKTMSRLDGGVEVLDDLDDHWTAKHHKEERNLLIQDLQSIAQEKSVRVTILSGDVHLGAIGQFYSNPKLGIPKDHDHRYMPNVISSAIVNTPPPDMLADVLNKRNKIHHMDASTDEDMIRIFSHDVDGKLRNNRTLLNRRNWCSIREFDPQFASPPPSRTPSLSSASSESIDSPRPGFLRRLSTSRSKPPLAEAGGFFSRGRESNRSRRKSTDLQRRPSMLRRTLSLTRQDLSGIFGSRSRRDEGSYSADSGTESEGDVPRRQQNSSGGLFRWRSRQKRKPDSGGINGYGADSESEEESYTLPQRVQWKGQHRPSGLRGGSGGPEDDDGYFPPYPREKAAGSRRLHKHHHQQRPHSPPPHPPPKVQIPVPSHPPHEASAPLSHANPNINQATTSLAGTTPHDGLPPHARAQFKRTPTNPYVRHRRNSKYQAKGQEVDLEGGLDICLNVEVSARDPSGITMPYRLLVPRLWAEEGTGEEIEPEGVKGGLKRGLSFLRGRRGVDG